MLGKLLDSFGYAFAGVFDLIKNQPNAKIHLFATVIVVVAGCYFGLTIEEWGLVVLAISMVFSAEAFNTALEYLTDLVSPGRHPLAGKAKDAAAGAVLLAAFGAFITGVLIFLPKVLARL